MLPRLVPNRVLPNATTASAECPKCGGKLKQLKVGSVCRKCYLYWLEPPRGGFGSGQWLDGEIVI